MLRKKSLDCLAPEILLAELLSSISTTQARIDEARLGLESSMVKPVWTAYQQQRLQALVNTEKNLTHSLLSVSEKLKGALSETFLEGIKRKCQNYETKEKQDILER